MGLMEADLPGGTTADALTQRVREQDRELAELRARLAEWEAAFSRQPQRTDGNFSTISGVPTEPLYTPVHVHGDKAYGDDRAILTGFAKIDDRKLMFVGQQKGRNLKERTEHNYGMAHPEGYRKALAKMQMAAKFGLPIVCFIDTAGAYPGIGAEERGQSQAIDENMYEMSRLQTPVICLVIGEGGSGGALGIGVGDRVAILQYSYYSVISPEGCSGILWKGSANAADAAEALKLTSKHLAKLGVIDTVVPEPLGGAHRDPHTAAHNLEQYLAKALRELKRVKTDTLLERRYEKFRQMGEFVEGAKKVAARSA